MTHATERDTQMKERISRWYELNARSRGPREETLWEARMRHPVEQGEGEPSSRLGSVLSVLHGAGQSE
jgi:hypothetical protein